MVDLPDGRAVEPDAPETSPRRRTGGRSARVRAAVLGATVATLIERGYPATSIGEIAQRAGVHETSIYRRWRTKPALVADALARWVEEAIPIANTGSLRDDLLQLLRQSVSFLREPIGAGILQLGVTTRGLPETEPIREAFWRSRLTQGRPILLRAARRGELPPDVDARLFFDVLLGPVVVRLLLTGDSLDERQLERIVEVTMAGFGVERGAGSAG
jgi:AcrR family transcriptional regulator